MGGTGDLSRKKLLPAFFHLYSASMLPEDYFVLGVSRSDRTDEGYRNFVGEALSDKLGPNDSYDEFLQNFFYISEDASKSECYLRLDEKIKEVADAPCNILFYLAVPPNLYTPILEGMKESALVSGGEGGYVRICIEKPFGWDLRSAVELDRRLEGIFDKKEVFRIDHYLAKGELENILAFRFSNVLFSPVWNREHIKRVEIDLWENFGIDDRGAFYDEVGALKDVGQNHALQMLALVAMESPGKLEAERSSFERRKVLEALKVYDGAKSVEENTHLAQYEGYENTKGVSENSRTETYFKMRAFVENNRWSGVPFIIEHGKKMPESRSEIRIIFKENLTCLCPEGPKSEPHFHTNTITFKIKPEHKIELTFWSKKPSLKFELKSENLSFHYGNDENLPDAYENIIYSALSGERLPFTSSEEQELAWAFIDPIVNFWKDKKKIHYKPGQLPDLS